MTSRFEKIALGAILILATALRVWHLNASLWYDEILTLTQFVRLPAAELLTTYGSLNNHILYTWLAKASVGLFGESAWALRLPAMLFGIGSIYFIWLLICDLGFRKAALVVALLLAISFHHVWFSQNARGYTAMLFFATTASCALLRALRTDQWKWWAAFGLSCAAALLIHLSSIFVIAGQATALLAALIWRKTHGDSATWLKLATGPAIAAAVCAALTLVVFVPLIPEIVRAFGDVAAPDPTSVTADKPSVDIAEWRNPLWTLWATVSSFGPIGFALPIAGLLAGWGAWRLLKVNFVVVGGALLSIPFALIALMAAGMRIWPRYFFVDIGILLACVVVGAFALAEFVASKQKWRDPETTANGLKIAGSLAMASAFVIILTPNYAHPKQDFTGAYAFVNGQRAPADKIVTVGLAEIAYHNYLAPDWAPVTTVNALDQVEQTAQGVWVVAAFPKHLKKNYPHIAAKLDSEFQLVRRFKGTLAGGDILVWRRVGH